MQRKSTDYAEDLSALSEWEEEKQRTRRAIEYVNSHSQREKPGMFVSGWGAVKFFAKVVLIAVLGWLLVVGALSL